MRRRSMSKTHGRHFFNGKRSSRGKRAMSKLHRDIPPSYTIGETFKKIGEQNGKERVAGKR